MPPPVFPVPNNPMGQRLVLPDLCSEDLPCGIMIATHICGVFTTCQALHP